MSQQGSQFENYNDFLDLDLDVKTNKIIRINSSYFYMIDDDNFSTIIREMEDNEIDDGSIYVGKTYFTDPRKPPIGNIISIAQTELTMLNELLNACEFTIIKLKRGDNEQFEFRLYFTQDLPNNKIPAEMLSGMSYEEVDAVLGKPLGFTQFGIKKEELNTVSGIRVVQDEIQTVLCVHMAWTFFYCNGFNGAEILQRYIMALLLVQSEGRLQFMDKDDATNLSRMFKCWNNSIQCFSKYTELGNTRVIDVDEQSVSSESTVDINGTPETALSSSSNSSWVTGSPNTEVSGESFQYLSPLTQCSFSLNDDINREELDSSDKKVYFNISYLLSESLHQYIISSDLNQYFELLTKQNLTEAEKLQKQQIVSRFYDDITSFFGVDDDEKRGKNIGYLNSLVTDGRITEEEKREIIEKLPDAINGMIENIQYTLKDEDFTSDFEKYTNLYTLFTDDSRSNFEKFRRFLNKVLDKILNNSYWFCGKNSDEDTLDERIMLDKTLFYKRHNPLRNPLRKSRSTINAYLIKFDQKIDSIISPISVRASTTPMIGVTPIETVSTIGKRTTRNSNKLNDQNDLIGNPSKQPSNQSKGGKIIIIPNKTKKRKKTKKMITHKPRTNKQINKTRTNKISLKKRR
jgi:hypothetical protein